MVELDINIIYTVLSPGDTLGNLRVLEAALGFKNASHKTIHKGLLLSGLWNMQRALNI